MWSIGEWKGGVGMSEVIEESQDEGTYTSHLDVTEAVKPGFSLN